MSVAAALKALAYLGTMLLVGGAVCVVWLAPAMVRGESDPANARRKRLAFAALVALGAAVLAASSVLEVANTLREVLGRVDADLVRRYLASTQHGQVVRERWLEVALVATASIALVSWPSRGEGGRPADAGTARPPGWRLSDYGRLAVGAVAVCSSLLLLYGFARLSHAAAMGGAAPLGADFTHMLAAAVWAGPLGYLALFAPGAGAPRAGVPGEGARAVFAAAMRRLSTVGALAVAVLAVTGTYNALGHVTEPAAFATSAYGTALWVKLALFALVVVVAALNRFRKLPRFLAGGPVAPLRRALRIEAALVGALLLVTGALTTAPLPHSDSGMSDAWTNLLHLIDLLRR